ncbi:NAD(P)-binding protein [Aspergillus ellipticus CBS 707.79]|uniref:NAD(P)-binding protein n=1 Tax=Aspergillus ellipticus CBS 707.79 TaxID=1448320 RepID=A0A319DNK6_9EURO|nr:NAD(P)-binding protein [Aspergillus ellipticus CBS 707.79]
MSTSREDLSARTIPFMELSDGTSLSMTAPPRPVSNGPAKRFEIAGNAIVTGGSGALGLAALSALRLQLRGPRDRITFPPDGLPNREDHRTGPRCDGRDSDRVRSGNTIHTLGDINILLCFAGVVGCTHALEMSAPEWRRTLDINATESLLCAQAVAKRMVVAGTGGSIVLTASFSAHRVNYPQPQAAYNVNKAAVVALKSSLAAEWARFGIRVNSVSPGYMDTILNEGEGLAEARGIWASRNPMGRMGVPVELTGAVT